MSYEGRTYAVDVPSLEIPRCSNCGELVFTPATGDQIANALRDKLQLLLPRHIREQRKQLRLNQKEFARLLGVAEASVSRWETNALVQSRALDNLMRVFFSVPDARTFLAGASPQIAAMASKTSPNHRSGEVADNWEDTFPEASQSYGTDVLCDLAQLVSQRGHLLSIGA